MGREAGRIDPKNLQTQRHLSQRLHRIGMEKGTRLVGRTRKLGYGLDGPHLGVCHLHRDQHRGFRKRCAKGIKRNETPTIRGKTRDAKTLRFEALGGCEHRVVLDGRDDDVRRIRARIACCRWIGLQATPVRFGVRDSKQGGVVRLGGARGERNLIGTFRA